MIGPRATGGTGLAVAGDVPSTVRVLRACVLGLALLAGGCDVGVIGPASDDTPEVPVDAAPDAAPDYSLRATPTARGALGTTLSFTVDASASAFTGRVTLAASGAPASWAVTITPPALELVDGGDASATVELRVPTNGDGAPAGQVITITGSAAPGTRTATSTVTVEDVYTLAIGTPGAQGQHFGALAGGQLRMKRGARLAIMNSDSVPHRIHSDGAVQGFRHQNASMAAGATYEVTLGSTGSDVFYCHDHGQGTGEVRLTVE